MIRGYYNLGEEDKRRIDGYVKLFNEIFKDSRLPKEIEDEAETLDSVIRAIFGHEEKDADERDVKRDAEPARNGEAPKGRDKKQTIADEIYGEMLAEAEAEKAKEKARVEAERMKALRSKTSALKDAVFALLRDRKFEKLSDKAIKVVVSPFDDYADLPKDSMDDVCMTLSEEGGFSGANYTTNGNEGIFYLIFR